MKSTLRGFISLFMPSYPAAIIYMLQSTEYQIGPYLSWYWRTSNFSTVMHRRSLHKTRAATLLQLAMMWGILLQLSLAGVCVWLWYQDRLVGGLQFAAALVISYPVVWAHAIVLPLFIGRVFIVWPKNQILIHRSRKIFANHPGVTIAVAGSYGKTSMKELLLTVLSEGKKVAATPANKNVASSHAQFAKKLIGEEEVLIIEYGEARPGDVAKFARTTHPEMAIITGVAPAHLDHYHTIEAAAKDIFSIADFVQSHNVFANAESAQAKALIQKDFNSYSRQGLGGWKVSNIKVAVTGTTFTCKLKGGPTLDLYTGLLGRHQIGPLAAAIAIAHRLGLSAKQIEAGVAKTAPFEHRMQPRNVRGAWIIDDSYNGNIEGIRAGLELLKELPAKRKIYVSPGLVDQGEETEVVHREMGRLIVKAKPDTVVLMQNSATAFIQEGLKEAKFSNILIIEDQPLQFYTNIDQFIAAGDVLLMQNDWTDNYA